MEFIPVLEKISEFLEGRGARWALAGGLALHCYGYTRATLDLDILVEEAAQRELVAFLESLGYETLHLSRGFSNHLHEGRAEGRVDVIYVDNGTADILFPACRREVLGAKREVLVPSPEHLIAMKVHAAKNDRRRLFRELADIQFLLNLEGVDREAVRGYFREAGMERHYDELQEKS